MKADDFKRLAVVSLETAAKLGYVEDLKFERNPLHVAAFRVKAERHEFLLPWSEVTSVGSDAITVPTDAAAHATAAESGMAALPGIQDLRKLKAVDEAGTYRGTVQELHIDPQSGVVTQVEVHAGGVLGLGGTTTTIAADEIGTIGDEVLLTTARSSEQKPDPTPKE